MLEAAPDGMAIVADDGRIVAVNSELERLFGYSVGDMLGASIELLVPADVRPLPVGLRDGYVPQPQRRGMGVGRHLYGQRRDGSVFPVQISLARIDTTLGAMTFAAVRDVTSRVESDQQLADANRRRTLAEDHDRIARDLHDTVIQELFGVGLGLQGLQSRITTPESRRADLQGGRRHRSDHPRDPFHRLRAEPGRVVARTASADRRRRRRDRSVARFRAARPLRRPDRRCRPRRDRRPDDPRRPRSAGQRRSPRGRDGVASTSTSATMSPSRSSTTVAASASPIVAAGSRTSPTAPSNSAARSRSANATRAARVCAGPCRC